jgi:radical SAM superfamily enzyme YgiQ (UPF0313 family)
MTPLRLLLVDPPFFRLYKKTYGLCKAPLGCASLAVSALRQADVEVLVCNADFHPDPEPFTIPYLAGAGYAAYRRALAEETHPAFLDVDRAVAAFGPDVVGIAVRTPLLASARIVARRVKRLAPEAFILAGGPHPSVVGEAILRCPEFDAAVLGEGEATLAACLQGLRRGRFPAEESGLVVRREGRAVRTPPRPPIEDLDALPFPGSLAPQRLVGGEDYPAKAFGHVFVSRGCPRHCAYCASGGVWGRLVRCRSIPSVLAELSLLADRGVRHVHFDDDTFGVTPDRLLALCRELELARLGLSFGCETHVSLINERSVEALARAGFATVQLGLESGDNGMLAKVGKGFTVEQARQAAQRVKGAGLRLEAFFMVGFPDETEETLAATRSLMEDLPCDKIIYSIFTPYPGTPLFDQCEQRDLIAPDFDPSRHNHQSPENAFCRAIAPRRFRELAGKIEALAAAKNAAARQA